MDKGTYLVVQGLRICLTMQGPQVQSLAGELSEGHSKGQLSAHATVKDSTCCNEEPTSHN